MTANSRTDKGNEFDCPKLVRRKEAVPCPAESPWFSLNETLLPYDGVRRKHRCDGWIRQVRDMCWCAYPRDEVRRRASWPASMRPGEGPMVCVVAPGKFDPPELLAFSAAMGSYHQRFLALVRISKPVSVTMPSSSKRAPPNSGRPRNTSIAKYMPGSSTVSSLGAIHGISHIIPSP